MKWQNLKQTRCPKCDMPFADYCFGGGFISCPCGFKIREKRYSEIVNAQINEDLERKYNKEFEEEDL